MTTFLQSFRKELEDEAIGTRKMLALVPADKLGWKPHAKKHEIAGPCDSHCRSSNVDLPGCEYRRT
jgi:hypothetical protein